jgi:hypothetical protein
MNDFTKFQLTNGARKLVIFLFYTTLIYFSSYLINFIWIGNKKSVYDNARKSVLISIGGEVDIDKNHAKLEEIFHNNPSARWLCASTYRIHEADVEKIIDIEIASSKSKRNGVREVSDKSFKIFKRERVVTPLPF